ncbi:MAG: endonuclease/exonuclease/phosphatase family protein [Bacteroidia bacterium]
MNTETTHNIQQPENTKKKKRGKRHFFNKIAMFFNHIVAVGLLISYLSPHVSPENFWYVAFFGLAYPFLVLANLLFIVYWFIQFKRRALYSFIIIVVGYSQLTKYVQFNSNSFQYESKKHVKIMSYNVRSFDVYNWNDEKDTRGRIFNLLNDETPDILCIQDFYTRTSDSIHNNLDTLLTIVDAKNYHVEYTKAKRTGVWGNATFTKFPIVAKGQIVFDNSNNTCIYTDMIIQGDTVRVYNVHLQSIHLSSVDYKFVDDILNNKNTEELENSKNIIRRLKRAFVKRSSQSDLVAEHIQHSPYSVIVCGDFNDPPASYSYNTIAQNLKDAFVESGVGFGKTYIGKFPSFRIDYILHSDKYKSYNFKTIRQKLSDHFPLTCYLVKE